MRSTSIYRVPSVTSRQAEQLVSHLTEGLEAEVNDPLAHAGGLTLYRSHVATLQMHVLGTRELEKRIRHICARPGLELTHVLTAVPRREYWAWIPPSLVTRGITGATFTPYHHSTFDLARMSRRILKENADAEGLLRLFGDPRAPSSGIVVSRLPGPLGPVYPITVNGNHRSIVLEALGVPAVLVEVTREDPPYQLRLRSEAMLETVWAYLTWLDEHGAIRLGSRRITRRRGITVHISAAVAPWLIGHPTEALRALTAYESIKGQRLVSLGPLAVSELRGTWGPSPEPEVDTDEVTLIDVGRPISGANPHFTRTGA